MMSKENPNQDKNTPEQGSNPADSAPTYLYTKIVETMKTEGLLTAPKALIPASITGIAGTILLCVCIAVGAFFAGKSSKQSLIVEKSSGQPRFALLVKADDVPPADGMQQFKQYTAWVENLKKDRWAGGEALHGKAWRLHKQGAGIEVIDHEIKTSADEMSGYFLFEAANKEEALKIARTCPHLNYQGTLELREIFQ